MRDDAHIEVFADHLRLRLGAPPRALRFHWFWLRHNCPREVHPLTRERTLDARRVQLDLFPRSARLVGDAVQVVWDDGESVFPLEWLVANAYDDAQDAQVAPPSSDLAPVTLVAGLGEPASALARRALAVVRQRGVVVARGAGLDTEALIDALAAEGLSVRSTHFGRIEDLRTDNTTNQNTDQLGYTDAPVELHTDQPFIDAPPRYQLLHAMRAATTGGENLIADAAAALAWLRAVDRPSFDLLTTTPVVFHRRQQRLESRVEAPLFRLDAEGALAQVRHSYFTFAPHRRPFDEMEAFYRAYQRFQRIVHDPAHHLRFLLGPGDFVFYDNHRMLHARTSFTGPRWVRGVYFDPP